MPSGYLSKFADSDLVSKFKDRSPKDEVEEGPPPDGEDPQGGGYGDGDSDADGMGAPGAPGEDVEMKAAEDMADILGVGPEDRQDFAAALNAYVHACVAKAMSEEEAEAMPPEGMPPAPGGMEEEEPEVPEER